MADVNPGQPGRVCPLRYRYGAAAMAAAPIRQVSCLYVVGGLYGNLAALDVVQAMALAEALPPRLCFNGDFNWFNCDHADFAEVNRRVLEHDATVGNVEAELGIDGNDAGCGCAYPDKVDAAVVQRSNQIHARLKTTACQHPDVLAGLQALPMFARYQVGACRIGVVHGDADALAGWSFDAESIAESVASGWLEGAFAQAQVELFASSHTCAPLLTVLGVDPCTARGVVNNGAAGMPNFRDELFGLCVRVGLSPAPHEVVHEQVVAGAYVALLPLRYEVARWRACFLANWPEGTPAWQSYFARISQGPNFTRQQALVQLR